MPKYTGYDIKTFAQGSGNNSHKKCILVHFLTTIDLYSQKYVGQVRGKPMLETVPHQKRERLTTLFAINPVIGKKIGLCI